jgi:NADH:ubiquinone oxidoreductase subunit K
MVAVALTLFSVGLYGVLTRRDLVAVLASIEVMIGGALVLFAGLGAVAADPSGVQAAGVLLIVLAAAEAALGLALLVAVARRARTTRVDDLTEVKG